MQVAYTMAPGRGDTDLLLHRFAIRLIALGYAPVGTVQTNTECAEPGRCDMDVKVLPDGPAIRISQSLGAGARGCRLDPGALETAVGLVERSMDGRPDCLIVNKFGKQEASGGGFRPLIGKAMEREIPVIVGLSRLNAPEFGDFTGGLAQQVAPELDALLGWFGKSGHPPGKAVSRRAIDASAGSG